MPEGSRAGALLGSLILVAVAGLAGLPALGDRDFWPQDEARYGAVALEMWQGAHPAVPHLNGQIYQDKPPGYFWLVNAAAAMRGKVDEWSARVPSVIGAALLALGAFWLLAPWAGNVAGLIAGLITLASWVISWEMRQAHLDVLFGGLIALAMASFTRAIEKGKERAAILGFAFLGLAVLVKGPLALVALATFAIAALLLRRPGALFNRYFLPGLILVVLPSVLWLAWAYVHLNQVKDGSGEEYIRALFGEQIMDRMVNARAHEQPWYFYLVQLPYGLIPFFPIVLLTLAPSVRRALGGARPAFVVAACWLVLSFIGQSAFPGKRLLYMVPLVAPFAVLCATVVQSGARGVTGMASGWFALVGCALFIFSATLVTAGVDDWSFAEGKKFAEARISEKLYDQEEANAHGARIDRAATESLVRERVAKLDWAPIRRGALLIGIVGLVLAAIGLTALAVGALTVGVAWTATGVAVTIGLAVGYLLPPFDVFISRKPIVLAAVEVAGPNAPIGCLRHLDEAFPYYAGRPVVELFGPAAPKDEAEKAKFRSAASTFLEQKSAVLVVRRDDFEDLHLRDLAKGGVKGPLRAGGKQLYLLEGPR